MCIKTIAIFCGVAALCLSVDDGKAVPPEHVRVEFLSIRSESAFQPGPGAWPLEYVLQSGGYIWLPRRASFMSDERLGRILQYGGSERRTRYLFLYVNDPERTEFSDVMRAVGRLKKIVATYVTGNCNVVIEILQRDWVFVYPPDERDEAEQVQMAGVNESELHGAPERAADGNLDADAP
jgi:hypothetical protein